MQTTNRESITFSEWLGAAGLSDKRYFSMWHEQCVTNAAYDAWKRGEDPTEYRSDHSSLEDFYQRSLKNFDWTGVEMSLPDTCCKNVGGRGPFKSCDKKATHWYKHNEDICSYCDEHDYQCGEKINGGSNGEGSDS